jgi:GDP-fucose protein O-fucosyltransferase
MFLLLSLYIAILKKRYYNRQGPHRGYVIEDGKKPPTPNRACVLISHSAKASLVVMPKTIMQKQYCLVYLCVVLTYSIIHIQSVVSLSKNYLLIDMNPAEGFNLRRDVLVRASLFVRELNKHSAAAAAAGAAGAAGLGLRSDGEAESQPSWTLVLPRFQKPIWHWYHASTTMDLNGDILQWSDMLDLNRWRRMLPDVPVIDYNPSLMSHIDHVIHLQSMKFDAKLANMRLAPVIQCNHDKIPWQQTHKLNATSTVPVAESDAVWEKPHGSYSGIKANQLTCVEAFCDVNSFAQLIQYVSQGFEHGWQPRFKDLTRNHLCTSDSDIDSDTDSEACDITTGHQDLSGDTAFLKQWPTEPLAAPAVEQQRTLFIDRFEVLFWSSYGSRDYWEARAAMHFAPSILEQAHSFIDTHVMEGEAFLAVHYRHRDFVRAHASDVPSPKQLAAQLNVYANTHSIDRVFIATDASADVLHEISVDVAVPVLHFLTSNNHDSNGDALHPARVAVIEQAICMQADFFVGTHHSFFTIVIIQQRELEGKKPQTTYNALCGDSDQIDCAPLTRHPFFGTTHTPSPLHSEL